MDLVKLSAKQYTFTTFEIIVYSFFKHFYMTISDLLELFFIIILCFGYIQIKAQQK